MCQGVAVRKRKARSATATHAATGARCLRPSGRRHFGGVDVSSQVPERLLLRDRRLRRPDRFGSHRAGAAVARARRARARRVGVRQARGSVPHRLRPRRRGRAPRLALPGLVRDRAGRERPPARIRPDALSRGPRRDRSVGDRLRLRPRRLHAGRRRLPRPRRLPRLQPGPRPERWRRRHGRRDFRRARRLRPMGRGQPHRRALSAGQAGRYRQPGRRLSRQPVGPLGLLGQIAAMPTTPPARIATCGVPSLGWIGPSISGR